jgi:hypothetical protein
MESQEHTEEIIEGFDGWYQKYKGKWYFHKLLASRYFNPEDSKYWIKKEIEIYNEI